MVSPKPDHQLETTNLGQQLRIDSLLKKLLLTSNQKLLWPYNRQYRKFLIQNLKNPNLRNSLTRMHIMRKILAKTRLQNERLDYFQTRCNYRKSN